MYKAKWFGKTVLKKGRFDPSSKTCHICAYKNNDLTLKERKWHCPTYDITHDRDINAAIKQNFALLGQEVEPLDSLLLEKGMKKEASKF